MLTVIGIKAPPILTAITIFLSTTLWLTTGMGIPKKLIYLVSAIIVYTFVPISFNLMLTGLNKRLNKIIPEAIRYPSGKLYPRKRKTLINNTCAKTRRGRARARYSINNIGCTGVDIIILLDL